MTSDELYTLAARHFSGEADSGEQAQLEQWLSADAANAAEFAAMQQLWATEAADVQPAYDVEAAWQKVSQAIATQAPGQNTGAKLRSIRWGRYAAAASVVLLLGLAFLFRHTLFGNNDMITVVADAAKTIQLKDGSTIHLHKGARLSYPKQFAAGHRDVELQGEAFFEIARNEASPFTVNAAGTRIQVLGTSFNINTYDGKQVRVIVKTGKVRFSAQNKAVELTPGESGLFSNGELSESAANENELAWHTGVLQFTNAALPDVLNTISQQYGVRIDISSSAKPVADTSRITAQFSNETAAEILGDLELLLPAIRFTPSGDSLYTLSNR
jgi:transmembrane sensor